LSGFGKKTLALREGVWRIHNITKGIADCIKKHEELGAKYELLGGAYIF